GLDTLLAFVRDRWLSAYGPAIRAARGCRPRAPVATRVVVSGDDLGLSSSVDRGILRALARGALTSVSLLAEGPTAGQAGAALRSVPVAPDAGVHVDLSGGRLGRFLLRAAAGLLRPADVPRAVPRQVP